LSQKSYKLASQGMYGRKLYNTLRIRVISQLPPRATFLTWMQFQVVSKLLYNK